MQASIPLRSSPTASATSTRCSGDLEYARWTRFGGLIAHPCFPWTHHWPGRSYWGLPGVHGFGVDHRLRVLPQRAARDRINIWNRVLGMEEKHSKFSGSMAMQYLESTYTNQRDEVICKALGLTARHERKASREKGKYKDVKTYRLHARRTRRASTRR